MQRRSKLPQGPRNIMEVFLKAQVMSYHGSTCLLAHPNPSFHNLSLFLTLHRLQHLSHSIYSAFYLCHLTHYYHCTPQSPFPYHHLLLLLPFLMPNYLYPKPAHCQPPKGTTKVTTWGMSKGLLRGKVKVVIPPTTSWIAQW